MQNLNINGQTTIDDVLAMIVDQVDSGDVQGAKDSLNELRDYFDMEAWTDHKSMVEQYKKEKGAIFPDARDHHLINQDFNRAFGVKK